MEGVGRDFHIKRLAVEADEPGVEGDGVGAAGQFVELRRTATVGNPSVTVSATVSGVTGLIAVDARAYSPFGVTAVSAALDGAALATLNSPNACSRSCGGSNDVYRFTVNAATAGSGAHTLLISAVDGAGAASSSALPCRYPTRRR